MMQPMLLAVDIGNTNVTIGRFEAGRLLGARRAATTPVASADQLEVLIGELLGLDGTSLGDVTAIVVGSVVPVLTAKLESLAAARSLPVLIATAGTIPIPIRVDRPAEVGADRLVNALAAARLYGAPAVVADFGTASTFDAVGPDGSFLGGAIAPGLELGVDALARRTAKLPRIELLAPDRVIGHDTVSAIQAGAVLGYQALANGLLRRMRRELADRVEMPASAIRIVLTGGLSALPWVEAIEGVDVIDPDLTLKGLAMLHAQVAGGEPLALRFG